MQTAKQILQDRFGGNITAAARETGITRQTWHAWKRAGFPIDMPMKLELWLLRQATKQ